MNDDLVWERDGADWPNRGSSRFVETSGLRWHVQRMGRGPVVLLIHGTGAATHSWRDLAPALAHSFTVLAPDLPGHGFTSAPPKSRLSLSGMAGALAGLLRALKCQPQLIVGHSAGAAIAVRMCLSKFVTPSAIVGLNGALLPFRDAPRYVYAPLAKLLSLSPVIPWLFARTARNPAAVERLLHKTGSTIDARGVELYGRVVRSPTHAASALGMMANWDLATIRSNLRYLGPRLFLVVAENDLTIPPSVSYEVQDLVADAEVIPLAGLGHLAHEEAPDQVASMIADLARSEQILKAA